jgi:cytochrome bd-type quinol oxidase subunit 2
MLLILLVATAVLMPIVIACTIWAFRARRGRVSEAEAEEGESSY